MSKSYKILTFITFVAIFLLFTSFLLKLAFNKKNPEKSSFESNLEKSLELYAEWFLKNQTERGDFNYEMDVQTGEIYDSYNIVRQAGSLYSLAHAYKYFGGEKCKNGLEKGISFFNKYLENVENDTETKRVNYDNSIKSNTTALYLLALIEYMETDDSVKSKYIDVSKNLADYILLTQNDKGGFYIHLGRPEESDYNNGESLYALIRMYKISGDEKYLEGAKKAADYIIAEYSNREFNYSLYSWAMQGLSHLYRVEPDEKYWDFIKSYSNKFLFNYGANAYKYFSEKNGNPPKSNLGVYLEGLNHVAWVSKEKDREYYTALVDFIEMSLKYLMTLQINGPGSDRTSDIELISGGVCYDYNCATQRIDLVHHNLSAIYLYLTLTK